jgi:hypothetical protein
MRLLEVEEMADCPSAAERMGLGPGDTVGLLVHSPSIDGWGDGVGRMEAFVVDVTSPGRYVGELPDGSPVRFGERNVAWINPALGGIFDLFIPKKREEAAQPGLPALPRPAEPPAPPKKSFFEIFRPAPPAEPPPAPPGVLIPAPPPAPPGLPRKPSIFDIFRRRDPGVPPGPPAMRPEAPLAPPEPEKPSMFAPLAPGGPGILERIREKIKQTFIPLTKPGLLTPQPPKMFEVIQPTPEVDFEARKVRQMELWRTLFPPTGEERPIKEMFKIFEPKDVEAEEQVRQRGGMPAYSKVLPLPARNMLLPAAFDVARGFMTFYEPVSELWDRIREVRADPAFQREVQKGVDGRGPGGRFEFESLGTCDGPPDVFQETASFFHIPWEEFRNRAEIVLETDAEGNEYEEWVDKARIWEEIMYPLAEIIHEAFEMMKPEDIPGEFILQWNEHGCLLGITYIEGQPVGAMYIQDNPYVTGEWEEYGFEPAPEEPEAPEEPPEQPRPKRERKPKTR